MSTPTHDHRSETLSPEAREMVRGWLGGRTDDAAIEHTARWMARTLRLGGLRACRELVVEAVR